MRYAIFPKAIQLRDLLTGKDGPLYPFREYAYTFWLNDPRWEKPRTNLARLAKILPLFDQDPGSLMKFEDNDWLILKDIVATPGVDHMGNVLGLAQPLFQLQLEPFCDLVINASETDPTEKPVNGASKAPEEVEPKIAVGQ